MLIKHTQHTNNPVFRDAISVREKVFIQEQQIAPHIELDELDNLCRHYVLYLDQQPVATSRIYPISDTTWKIQRVAVLKDFRNKHLGAKLMAQIEQDALAQNILSLTLGAQINAVPFYEKLGYETTSPEFLEANIPHKIMTKYLTHH